MLSLTQRRPTHPLTLARSVCHAAEQAMTYSSRHGWPSSAKTAVPLRCQNGS